MNIRTRAFVGLWLLSILAVCRIGFVVYASIWSDLAWTPTTSVSPTPQVHSSVWRALTDLKYHQRAYELTGPISGARSNREAGTSPADYFSAPQGDRPRAEEVDLLPRISAISLVDGRLERAHGARPGESAKILLQHRGAFAPIAPLWLYVEREGTRRAPLQADAACAASVLHLVDHIAPSAARCWLCDVLRQRVVLDPLTELTARRTASSRATSPPRTRRCGR